MIYPPVDTDFFCPAPVRRGDYYLAVSAFAPYKRLDLAIAACNRLRRSLGNHRRGQDANRLRTIAGPTVHFLGWQPDTVVRDYFRRCRALLFPGEEDFGMVPVEAQACGTPVIAYGRGGATETVIPPGSRLEPTGLFFAEQTSDCLAAALQAFEASSDEFAAGEARRQALRFNHRRFEQELLGYLQTVLHPGRVSAQSGVKVPRYGPDLPKPPSWRATQTHPRNSIAMNHMVPIVLVYDADAARGLADEGNHFRYRIAAAELSFELLQSGRHGLALAIQDMKGMANRVDLRMRQSRPPHADHIECRPHN